MKRKAQHSKRVVALAGLHVELDPDDYLEDDPDKGIVIISLQQFHDEVNSGQ